MKKPDHACRSRTRHKSGTEKHPIMKMWRKNIEFKQTYLCLFEK